MAHKHYDHQIRMANQFVIPQLRKYAQLCKNSRVLEVGCAEAGVLKVLSDKGISCMGIELLQSRITLAKSFNPDLNIIQGDITDSTLINRFDEKFDLIIIRDVIEHIRSKEKAFEVMNSLLKPGGFLYITFPPLYSPFAGHQQNGKGFVKKFLWIHLLPSQMIRFLGNLSNERPKLIDEIILNGKIGLTISNFQKMFKRTGFSPIRKDLYLSRPIYKIRWNWPVIKLPHIPILKEFFATGCEYILRKK